MYLLLHGLGPRRTLPVDTAPLQEAASAPKSRSWRQPRNDSRTVIQGMARSVEWEFVASFLWSDLLTLDAAWGVSP